MKRTLQCVVATWGLRGWNTSDTPMPSKGTPTSPGAAALPAAVLPAAVLPAALLPTAALPFDAFLSTATCLAFAASRKDAAALAAARTGAEPGVASSVTASLARLPAGFLAPAAALADPFPAALAFLRPHLPKVRTGAAANNAWHCSKVKLLGSRSLGIFALRCLSVM